MPGKGLVFLSFKHWPYHDAHNRPAGTPKAGSPSKGTPRSSFAGSGPLGPTASVSDPSTASLAFVSAVGTFSPGAGSSIPASTDSELVRVRFVRYNSASDQYKGLDTDLSLKLSTLVRPSVAGLQPGARCRPLCITQALLIQRLSTDAWGSAFVTATSWLADSLQH